MFYLNLYLFIILNDYTYVRYLTMKISNSIKNIHKEVISWRHDLHANPELCYEEKWTANFITEKLKSFNIEVHQGIGKTGVLGVLKGLGSIGNRSIGLRADMDALPIKEDTSLPYKSKFEGKMHACGHDGHIAMLLGAAKILSSKRQFSGTVYFIFQPAEEGGAGGLEMINDGLFENFSMESVWGLHNWPGLNVGEIAVHYGPVMASFDQFRVVINGIGGHAAAPHLSSDPILAASNVIQALQQIISRRQNPLDSVVVSVTKISSGTAFNIIPQTAEFLGTIRTLNSKTRSSVHEQFFNICNIAAQAYDCKANVDIIKGYPVTINSIEESDIAIKVAKKVVEKKSVMTNLAPSMGAEDFAYMLEHKPGAYIWLGAGEENKNYMLHNSKFDFNDKIIPLGISYWCTLVQDELPLVK